MQAFISELHARESVSKCLSHLLVEVAEAQLLIPKSCMQDKTLKKTSFCRSPHPPSKKISQHFI